MSYATVTKISPTQLQWNVTLSSVFSTSNYYMVGCGYAAVDCTGGTTTMPWPIDASEKMIASNASTGGSTTTPNGWLTVSPNTTYTIYFWAETGSVGGYKWYNVGSATYSLTVTTDPLPALGTPTVSVGGITTNGCTVYTSSVANATTTHIEYLPPDMPWTTLGTCSNGGSFTTSSLASNTTYYFRAYCTATGYTTSAYSASVSCTTLPPKVLSSITVTPTGQTLYYGQVLQYTAMANYTFPVQYPSENITSLASWSSTAGSISSGYLLVSSAYGTGTKTVSAVYQGVTGQTTLTVYAPTKLTDPYFTSSTITTSSITFNIVNPNSTAYSTLQYSLTGDEGTFNTVVNGQVSFTGLGYSTTKTIYVRAIPSGSTAYAYSNSNIISRSETTLPQPPLTTPTFSSSSTGTTTLTSSWTSLDTRAGANTTLGMQVWRTSDNYYINTYYVATGGATSGSVTATGLASSTQYTFNAFLRDNGGTYAASPSTSLHTATTQSALPPAVPGAPSLVSRGADGTSITISWTAVATATSYNVNCSDTGTIVGIGTTSYTVTGRIPGNAVTYQISATNSNGTSALGAGTQIRSAPAMPTIVTSYSGGTTTVTATLGADGSSAFTYVTFYRKDQSGTTILAQGNTSRVGVTNTVTYVFTSTATSDRYQARAFVTDFDGDIGGVYSAIAATTLVGDFAWDHVPVSGGNFALTAVEWNRLISTIQAARANIGLGNATITAATATNPLTATMFNQVVSAITYLNPNCTISAKTTGGTMFASEFNDMVAKLNAVT